MNTRKTSKKGSRGAVHKSGSTLVAVWIPNSLRAALDDYVARNDTDRSKTMRTALRRHIRTPAA